MAVTFDNNISTHAYSYYNKLEVVKYDSAAGTYSMPVTLPTAATTFDYFGNTAKVGDWIGFCWNRGVWHDLAVYVGTAIAGAGHTIAWEYAGYNAGGSLQWNALTCTDNTSGFTVTGANTITFSVPDDWFYVDQYSFSGISSLRGGPMIRARITAVVYTVAAAVFSGSGLDDATSGGTYSGTGNSASFEVEIDATGTPDTFKWRKGSGAYTTGVAITGAAQTLSDGITITFAATTGHTLGDKWTISITSITEGGANSTNTIDAKDYSIQVTGSETLASVYAADVAGGWNRCTKPTGVFYYIDANLKIGNGSTATTFTLAADDVLQLGEHDRTNTGTKTFKKKRTLITYLSTDTFNMGTLSGSEVYDGAVLLLGCYYNYLPYNYIYCDLNWYASTLKVLNNAVGYANAAFSCSLDIRSCILDFGGTCFFFSMPTGTNPFYDNVVICAPTNYMYSFDQDLTIDNLTLANTYGVLTAALSASVSNIDFGSTKYFSVSNSGNTGSAVNCTFDGAYATQVICSAANTAHIKYDIELDVRDVDGNVLSSVNCRIKDGLGNVIHNGAYVTAIRVTVYTETGTSTYYDPFEIWVWKAGYEMYYEKLAITNDTRKRKIALRHSPTFGRAGMSESQR